MEFQVFGGHKAILTVLLVTPNFSSFPDTYEQQQQTSELWAEKGESQKPQYKLHSPQL